MKRQKIVALIVSLAMVMGCVACSNEPAATTAATTAAPATEATTAAPEETTAEATDATEESGEVSETAAQVEAQTSDFVELTVQDVADEDSNKIMIYGWNDEFPGLVEKYSDVDFDKEITETNTYQAKLDQVLASGDNAPDLFVCDADYATKYMNSDNTIAINNIGIAYDELSEMYNYTLQFACDDNMVIKGLAWQACPCGVFYNRTVAANTLGVSEPDEVAPYFASWDAFIETARLVNEKSEGANKIVSGTDEIWRAYLNSRSQGWVVDGEVYLDPVMEGYFDIAKVLKDENLTFEAGQWSDPWTANMANQTVLSYWGPMWLFNFCFNFGTTNHTEGDWGIVPAPGNFFWGGTWMMASKYCDNKATAAQIMRDIALTEDNLRDMTVTGEFVNNVSIMTELATSSDYVVENLGGQNPAAVLLQAATLIDNSTVGPNDQAINTEFQNVVSSYLAGDIATVAEATTTFENNVAELGIV